MGDMYSIYDYVPAEGVNRQIDQGLGTAGQAYQQYQQNYSPEFKAHLQRVLEGGEDPVAVARELKGKMSGQPQQPQQPQGMPAFGSASGAGAMMGGMGAPQQPQQQMPQSMPSFSRAGGLGEMSMPQQRQAPQQPAFSETTSGQRPMMQAPQQQEPQQMGQRGMQPQYLRTDADVRGAMSLMPYMQAKKSSQQPRDYMGEENNKQRNRLGLEEARQGGRESLMDMRNAERQLEQAAELAYKAGVLDEQTAYHLDTIKLGYAKLRSMEGMLDRNIDYKRESGDDDQLKTARTVVDSLTASEGQLIGSAFARTPEGQVMLTHLHQTLGIWTSKLNSYATQPVPSSTRTTTEVKGGSSSQRKSTPAGAGGAKTYKVGDTVNSPSAGKVKVTGVDAKGNITTYTKVK